MLKQTLITAGKDYTLADYEDVSMQISRELRTPLTTILGVLKLLKHEQFGELSQEGIQLIDMALRNTDRLSSLAYTLERQHETADSMLYMAELEILELSKDMVSGLERDEFFLHYQPIVTIEDQTIVGFEALARWHHPQKGLISPGLFVPMAEQIGLIKPLGLKLLRQACQQLHAWQKSFPAAIPLTMNVNLSTRQLSEPNLSQQIEGIIQSTGIIPNTLKLEVTESAVIENEDIALETFLDLKALGVQIYVDDFGTGYSSLARLQNLPFDALKIDQSFIRSHNWKLSKAILSLASCLDLDVVAEGIETKEEYLKLSSLGCKKMQGYLFSKPLTCEAAGSRLNMRAQQTALLG
jgi:EAL domain-containing protein (putative c-di-GMP-specific phosphodiesterase class I)